MVHDDADGESNVLFTDGVECDGAWWCRWCMMMRMVNQKCSLQMFLKAMTLGGAWCMMMQVVNANLSLQMVLKEMVLGGADGV